MTKGIALSLCREQKGKPMAKIYQNKSVSRKLYFVPLYPVKTRGIEASKIGGYEIALTDNGRWKCTKAEYYKISLSDAERFPVVGEVKIDIKEYVKGAILEALERKSWNESN